MKALQINSEVNLTSGMVIPSGAVVILAEGYADIKNQKDGLIPSQIATFVYANKSAFESGKLSINDIADFNTTISGNLTLENYETLPCETLLLTTLTDALSLIYGAENIVEINVTPV